MQSKNSAPTYPTIEDAIGKTPLAALQRIGVKENLLRGNVILGKLEGNNPAGSVKDRPALSMIQRAQERGEIQPGDTLIEATSGNTGIALAMAAAIKGYRMVLIMPEDLSIERAQTMKAVGAELILTPKSGGMESARDLAENMRAFSTKKAPSYVPIVPANRLPREASVCVWVSRQPIEPDSARRSCDTSGWIPVQ